MPFLWTFYHTLQINGMAVKKFSPQTYGCLLCTSVLVTYVGDSHVPGVTRVTMSRLLETVHSREPHQGV